VLHTFPTDSIAGGSVVMTLDSRVWCCVSSPQWM